MKIDLDFGILYQEILVTALKEYKSACNRDGNYTRADVVQDIINKLPF